MENNKNKKSVKFQGDMLNFYDFIQVFVFTTNHHLNVCDLDKNSVLPVMLTFEMTLISVHERRPLVLLHVTADYM